MAAMRRLMGGLGFGGNASVAVQPASKRQKRADLLAELDGPLGGCTAASTSGQRSSAAAATTKADKDALLSWFTDGDGGQSAASTTEASLKVPDTSGSQGISATSNKAVSAAGEQQDNIVEVAQIKEQELASRQEDGNSAASSKVVSTAGEQEEKVDEVAHIQEQDLALRREDVEQMQTGSQGEPAKITGTCDGHGWQAPFASARDTWDVEVESLRGRLWDSETGCCFEWDQASGTLFQLISGDSIISSNASPDLCPIWSAACPEKHAWVWESLPMPPTDPAAKRHNWNLDMTKEKAETVSETKDHSTVGPGSGSGSSIGGDEGSSSSNSASMAMPGSSSSTSMPPPSLLPKKKLSSGHPAVEGSQLGSGSSAGSTASASASSASSVALQKEGPSTDDCYLLEEQEASDSSFLVAAGVLDEDDATNTLAAGEVGALPLPPQRSAPKACDMELDMFGAPEEESAGLVD